MSKFSERFGFTAARTALQVTGIDDGLRNRLWNLISAHFFENAPPYRGATNDWLPADKDVYLTFVNLWHNHLKRTTDTIGNSYFNALESLREYFLRCNWYEVYDLVEFLALHNTFSTNQRKQFVDSVNKILKEEMSGYRFVSDQIAQITSEQEIVAIEEALSLGDSLKAVREHLAQALKHLSDRKNPDYRNSIKESISAIEGLSKIISGLSTATLGPALNAVDKTAKLHPSLKEGFNKLYGYTSDAQGIRHALMDESTLDFEDAKFMLVSCSAFVNYLIVKSQKAGIRI